MRAMSQASSQRWRELILTLGVNRLKLSWLRRRKIEILKLSIVIYIIYPEDDLLEWDASCLSLCKLFALRRNLLLVVLSPGADFGISMPERTCVPITIMFIHHKPPTVQLICQCSWLLFLQTQKAKPELCWFWLLTCACNNFKPTKDTPYKVR